MSIKLVMPSNHLILCHPLLLLPSIFPSIRVFTNESVLYIRWPKYWSFSFDISPSNEYSGLISFRMDWWDLLAVQGTLKSLLQCHSSKASFLQCSAFFCVCVCVFFNEFIYLWLCRVFMLCGLFSSCGEQGLLSLRGWGGRLQLVCHLGSSQTRGGTRVPCFGRGAILYC